MMKECKHKNIVAYFGSYHRCCALPACGIPGIVGGLGYVAAFLSTLSAAKSLRCRAAAADTADTGHNAE